MKTVIRSLIIIVSAFFSPAILKAQPQINICDRFNKTVLGPNVFVVDPATGKEELRELLDTLFARQTARHSEFSKNRYAVMFRPGNYEADVRVEYYMDVMGLGGSPGDVIINGAVRSNTTHGNSVLTNFWRSVSNMTIIPAVNRTMIWGVSQAAPLRRVHVRGNLQLFDKGYASGGFLADSKIDGVVSSGPQQQWLSRNTEWQKWEGGNWNMMFIGVPQAPEGNWPDKPYTTIAKTPLIREKPYLAWDEKGFSVHVPGLKNNSEGPGWTTGGEKEKIIRLDKFYIVREGADNANTINAALKKGKNLLITPGRYFLDASLRVTKPGTVIIGIGIPSITPVKGTAAIEIADVDGVSVCGLTIDAGPEFSDQLFTAGQPGSGKSHSGNPSFFYDIFFRVGGPAEGSARVCMVINSNDVYVDHVWLWRADHGNGVGWDRNRCANGLIVNGNNVTVYGLFNEHFQEYQTIWNGENGKTYFYQSEMPYDPPSADAWKHGTVNGYASYKVSDDVKSHEAWGLGIYNVFYNAPCIADNAIETPASLEKNIHHKIIFWLNGNKESEVRSIINGKGGAVNVKTRKQVMD